MNCDLSATDATCPRCGFVSKIRGAIRQCQAPATTGYLPRPMLGDAVAWLLTAIGITEARVTAWLGGADCGCRGRRKWLNRAGVLAVDRLETWLNILSRFALGG
jgi:hypothetical protein